MLSKLTPTEVVGRLRRERERAAADGSGPPVLAFDADGTLWSGDVGIDLFEAALDERALREPALEALEVEAERLGLSVRGDPNEVARALYAAYSDSRYEEPRAFAMMAWAFAGFSSAELEAFTGGVLASAGIEQRLHAHVRPILDWARAEGVHAHVVSASPRAAVVAAAAYLGLDASRVMAMSPAVVRDVVEPRLDGPVVYAEGKLDALRSIPGTPVLLGAFGDSGYDTAMLRAARVAVAVDPKPSLLAVATTVPGLVELCS